MAMDSYFVVVVIIFIVVFPIIVIWNLVAGPSMVTIRTNVFYAVAVGIVHAAEGTFCCHSFLYLRVKPFINSVSEGTYSGHGSHHRDSGQYSATRRHAAASGS